MSEDKLKFWDERAHLSDFKAQMILALKILK